MAFVQSKYVNIDPNNPEAIAICDYSGFLVMHKDLMPQMDYIGDGLKFRGFWVHPKFADKPNPQFMPPRLRPDPIPIDHPRPSPLITTEY